MSSESTSYRVRNGYDSELVMAPQQVCEVKYSLYISYMCRRTSFVLQLHL